jgi:hypothetical protein
MIFPIPFGRLFVAFLLLPAVGLLAAESTLYYQVKINGSSAGHMVIKETTADGKVTTETATTLNMQRLGTDNQTVSRSVCVETEDGKPLALENVSEEKSGTSSVKASFSDDGKTLDISILSTKAGDTVRKRQETVPETWTFSHAQRLILLKGKPWKQDQVFTFKSYSLELYAVETDILTYRGREKITLPGGIEEAYAFDVVSKIGSTTLTGRMWLDGDAQMRRMTLNIMGIVQEMNACSEVVAKAKHKAVNLTANMVVKAPRDIARDLGVKAMCYTVLFTGGDPVTAGDSPTQTIAKKGNHWLICVRNESPAAKMAWPYKGDDVEAKKNLEATSTLQCDNDLIIKIAKIAARGNSGDDALATARGVASFVHGYIRNKNYEVSYGTALDTAKSGTGDCTEHSVLTAALCRAVGIPARPVVGLGYTGQELDGGLKGGYFVGHQWTEVWINGKWYPVDAAMPGGFDIGHIRFGAGNGSEDDVAQLLHVMEMISKITVLRADKTE